jgi:hypothetical protein
MSDIFISYSRKDRDKAKPIAEALEKLGWSVWWDLTIPAGKTFAEVISEALAGAKSIVVLWSSNAIVSNWVLDEAQEGLEKNTLVPVFIERGVQPPLGYRRIQAADLVDWDGKIEAPEFKKFVSDISMILGRPPDMEKKLRRREEEEAKQKTQVERRKKEKQADLSKQNKHEPAEEKEDIQQKFKADDRQLKRKPRIGLIAAISILCISFLAIIFFKLIPHLTNSRSLTTANEPGVYLYANTLAGTKLDESMVKLVQIDEQDGIEPDLPLYYSDIKNWCLLIDLRQGQALTWDNIGECLE